MENNEGFKLLGLDSLVSVKLTDRGYEHLKNFYLTNFDKTGYMMFDDFRQNFMYGKIITASLHHIMLVFGSELMGQPLFESSSFVIHDSCLKEIDAPKQATHDEVVSKMM